MEDKEPASSSKNNSYSKNRPKPFERKIIASPEDYSPISNDFKIVGAFNSGAVKIKNKKGEIEDWLLVRVAQEPIQDDPNKIKLPYFKIPNKENQELQIGFDTYLKKDIINEGKKEVEIPENETYRMKHISLPMLLKLDEKGNIIERQQKPLIYPAYEYERFGMEDFRITDMTLTGLEKKINNSKNWIKGKLGYGESLQGNYVLTYVIPHRDESVSTPFIITKDFKNFKRLPEGNTPRPPIVGIKDVIPFPEKVKFPHKTESIKKNQKVYAGFIRPSSFDTISKPGVWVAYSSDGIIWGNPHRLTKSQRGEITGSGTPPIKLNGVWLAVYHEAKDIGGGKKEYINKLMMVDVNQPWKNFRNSEILTTREDYRELLPEDGYVENVVFANGLTTHNGICTIYEGVGDKWQAYSKYYAEDLVKFTDPSIKKNYFQINKK